MRDRIEAILFWRLRREARREAAAFWRGFVAGAQERR